MDKAGALRARPGYLPVFSSTCYFPANGTHLLLSCYLFYPPVIFIHLLLSCYLFYPPFIQVPSYCIHLLFSCERNARARRSASGSLLPLYGQFLNKCLNYLLFIYIYVYVCIYIYIYIYTYNIITISTPEVLQARYER